jgi:hypothetical protein
MKNTVILLIISLLFLLSGCGGTIWMKEGECDYCYSEKPELVSANLIFSGHIIQEDEASSIWYTVYDGEAFNSEVIEEGYVNKSDFKVYLEPSKTYTVVAIYFLRDKTYYVINECFTKIKYLRQTCDNPCYYVYDIQCELNLSIP